MNEGSRALRDGVFVKLAQTVNRVNAFESRLDKFAVLMDKFQAESLEEIQRANGCIDQMEAIKDTVEKKVLGMNATIQRNSKIFDERIARAELRMDASVAEAEARLREYVEAAPHELSERIGKASRGVLETMESSIGDVEGRLGGLDRRVLEGEEELHSSIGAALDRMEGDRLVTEEVFKEALQRTAEDAAKNQMELTATLEAHVASVSAAVERSERQVFRVVQDATSR